MVRRHAKKLRKRLMIMIMLAAVVIPFQAGIDAGSDMIMTAHIQFPKIEKKTYVSIKDGEVSFLDEYLYERGFGIKEW